MYGNAVQETVGNENHGSAKLRFNGSDQFIVKAAQVSIRRSFHVVSDRGHAFPFHAASLDMALQFEPFTAYPRNHAGSLNARHTVMAQDENAKVVAVNEILDDTFVRGEP